MHRVLLFLDSVFSLWMLVDAIRRGAAYYWYPVIMMPFGEWVYFFMVKIHDPELEWLRQLHRKLTTKKVTVEQLRFQLEQTPSFTNTLTLAQALYDRESYREAAELFEKALAAHDDSRDALYGLALARAGLHENDAAIEHLRQLIALDASFRDYAAWSDLADILVAGGRKAEALELLGELAAKSPRLNHRVLYAHYLMHDDRRDEARRQLEAGLLEHAHAPKFLKRKYGVWAGRAKRMLKQLRA